MKTRDGYAEPRSPFNDVSAVQTWDTWFRWREDGQLRDLTIEDTWDRVASALAAGPARPPAYKQHLFEAFAAWQLLVDERVIATAGTQTPQWRGNDLRAVLNAASFVRTRGSPSASFDFALFEDIAALAVHALDDAARLTRENGKMPQTRVGVVGVGNALERLGLRYDSDLGRTQAANMAQAVAQGCLAGSIALARDRGARAQCDAGWTALARRRGYHPELIEAAQQYGLHQQQLTAITSQPRLVSFANGVADAIDPLCETGSPRADRTTNASHRTFAPDISLSARAAVPADVAAQLQMRAAVQPWIDERISYPVCLTHVPEAAELAQWNVLACELGQAPLSWRYPPCTCRGT